MAVVSVTEIWEGRSGNKSLEKFRREYQRVFRVYTDSNHDAAATIITHPSLPALGSGYITPNEADAGALCKKVEASQNAEDPLQWTVTATYDTDVPDPEEQEENPLNRPAQWKFSFSKYTKAVEKDLDDKAIVNSAGMPFLPPVEIDQSRPVINVTINKATFSYIYVLNLQDAVNMDAWNGFAPNTLKIAGIEVSSQYENNIAFWQLTYNIEVNWEGWNPMKVLDQGYYEKELVSGEEGSQSAVYRRELIRDDFGQPMSGPTLLNGSGEQLPEGSDPVYLNFRVYRTVSFAGIP